MFQCQLSLGGRRICVYRVCGGDCTLLLAPHAAVRDDAAEDALPGRGRVQGPDHLAHGLAPQQRAVPGRELRVV